MNFRLALLLIVFPVSSVHGQLNFLQRLGNALRIIIRPSSGLFATLACNQGINILAGQIGALADFGITADNTRCSECGNGLGGTQAKCTVNNEICFIDTDDLKICGTVTIDAQCGGVGGDAPDGCRIEICFQQADGSNYYDVCVNLDTNSLINIATGGGVQLNGCGINTKDIAVNPTDTLTSCECVTTGCDGGFTYDCANLDLTRDDEVVVVPAQTECFSLLEVDVNLARGDSLTIPFIAVP